MNKTLVLIGLSVLAAALVLAGVGIGVYVGGDGVVEYPTPEEAVQQYVESTSDLGQPPGFKLRGTLPIWNGVLVVYTSSGPTGIEYLNYRLATHGGSGWRADTGINFGVSEVPEPDDVVEWHTDSRVDYSPGLNAAVETGIVFGRTTTAGVAVIEADFDQGQTLRTVPTGGYFAMAAVGSRSVLQIRAIGEDGSVLRVIDRRMVVP